MIVITGGAGFVGSSLLHHLNEKGLRNILVVDHLDHGPKWKNLVGASFEDFVDRKDFLDQLLKNKLSISTLFHLGACSRTMETDSNYLFHNNTLYSRQLAQYSIENKVKFIYASSAATYGDGLEGYDDNLDNLDTLKPLNMYGYSKHLFDQWARDAHWFDHITGFKLFNVFGPREDHKGDMQSLVSKSFDEVNKGQPLHLFRSYKESYRDGEQTRDFIYIDDVVKVLFWAYKNPQVAGLFNLGRGEATTWNHLAESLFAACDRPTQIEYIDMPEELKDQYQYETRANMNKLRASGYDQPFLTIKESAHKFVSWQRQNSL